MTKVTMPEPVAWQYFDGTYWVTTIDPKGHQMNGRVIRTLTPTTQAEAYADARVRKALEEAVMILNANAEVCHSDTRIMLRANAEAIRALIPKVAS